ncbi:MAG: 30S ribosomal protein S12 methylthiotransferase RimO [Deltaproteobacteria bacterium]|nr:30S ribosomal protein S12 methylthiotransferase RimO [Deltaproteobacteria bacterium]
MKSKLSIIGEPSGGESCCSSGVSMNVQEHDYAVEPQSFQGRAAVITLGCAKNQVDSEVMLGVLKNSGYEIVTDVSTADVAIINTCGFLESAIKESIDCILDVAEYKQSGRLRKLIVAGCLVERYKGDIKAELPEVDEFLAIDDVLKVSEAAAGTLRNTLDSAARPYFLYDDNMPRYLASKRHTAYVKISEGCNRPCTFCIIPKIRGGMRSRTLESVVREVVSLGEQGVREVNLVAQDLTSYGTDLKGPNLAKLLQSLDASKAVDWVRILYSYPIGIDEELLDTIAASSHVCKYLDLPLQHSSEAVLKEMKRPLGRYSPRKVTEFIKSRHPSIHMRTTFIVGFPGETEADVADLEQFILEGHFSSVGIFTYSPEPGTPSHDMTGQVAEEEKKARRERLMLAQQSVVEKRLHSYVGTQLRVLVEGEHEETELLLTGRAEFQAPDVDGIVILNDSDCDLATVQPGDFVQVEITEVAGYDLVGKVKSAERTQSIELHEHI